MNTQSFEFTPSGQLLKITRNTEVLANPDVVIRALSQINQDQMNAAPEVTKDNIQCFRNLGQGVCAITKDRGATRDIYGSVYCPELYFYMDWVLKQDPKINGGKAFITPNVNEAGSESFNVGAPLCWPVPSHLIIYFTAVLSMDLTDSHAFNPIQPIPEHLTKYPEFMMNLRRHNYFLTCFNTERNTCVNLPLPNHYDDCHLCAGNAFSGPTFPRPEKHDGFVTSMLSFRDAWSNTSWNLHIMDNPTDYKCQSFQNLIRFDAATGKALPPSGLEYWDIASPPIPVEELYKPFIQPGVKAVPLVKYPGNRPRVQNF